MMSWYVCVTDQRDYFCTAHSCTCTIRLYMLRHRFNQLALSPVYNEYRTELGTCLGLVPRLSTRKIWKCVIFHAALYHFGNMSGL